MHEISINKGSDLYFTGVWKDPDGIPVDYTGYILSVYDTSPVVSANMTLSWVDASVGSYSAVLQWSEKLQSGIKFRLRVSSGGVDLTSPLILVNVV